MSNQSNVMIVGGGIAGTTMALFLKRIGMQATIYEAAPVRRDAGGGFQIAPNGMKILHELGLAQQVIDYGTVSKQICFFNQQGKKLAQLDLTSNGKYGQPAVVIGRSTLHQMIVDQVEQQGIKIEYGKKLQSVTDQSGQLVVAHFQDGSTAQGDFLIGADGVHSRTRESMIKDCPKPFYTGILNIGGFVSSSNISTIISPEKQHLTFGKSGFFGYSQCNRNDPEKSYMWWSNLPVKQEMSRTELANFSTEQLRQQLLKTHRGWHGSIEEILLHTPKIMVSNVYDIESLPTWSNKRVVLIGDAAHAMSPSAGQGASISMEDSMYLANLLKQNQPIEIIFSQFERERRPRIEKIIKQARQNGNVKKTHNAISCWIRDRIMSIVIPLFAQKSNDEIFHYSIDWT